MPRSKKAKAEAWTPAGPAPVPVEEVLEAAAKAAEEYAAAHPAEPPAEDRATVEEVDFDGTGLKATVYHSPHTPPETSPENPPESSQDATTDTPPDSSDVPPPESLTEAAEALPEDAAISEQEAEFIESRQIDPETVEADARPIPPEVVAASDPETSEELLSLREWSRQVESMNADILELEAEHEEDKKRAKASKTRLEAAQSDLNQFIAKGQESHPLFDKPKPKTAPASKASTSSTPPASTSTPSPAPARPAEDEAWKSVELSTLGFSAGVLAKLQEAGLETVGKLAAWSNAGKRLTDIAGIGEAKAEEIENVMAGFWERKAKAQAEAEAQAKAQAEPVEAPAEPVAPEAPVEPAKPKRTRRKKGEAVEETPSETRSVADQLDAQADAAEALDGPEPIEVNEYGQPIDIEESLKEHFEGIESDLARGVIQTPFGEMPSGIVITGQDDVTTVESDLISFDDDEPDSRQLYE